MADIVIGYGERLTTKIDDWTIVHTATCEYLTDSHGDEKCSCWTKWLEEVPPFSERSIDTIDEPRAATVAGAK